MGKHRRYPTKNNKNYRIKRIHPGQGHQQQITTTIEEIGGNEFEQLGPSKQMEKRNIKKNKPPPASMIEDQPTTRRQRELQELNEKIRGIQHKSPKRVKKPKNSLLGQAQKLGFHQRPWEDSDALVHRISRETNKAINEELLKARFGNAGRDVNEIKKEYQAIDEKSKQKQRKFII